MSTETGFATLDELVDYMASRGWVDDLDRRHLLERGREHFPHILPENAREFTSIPAIKAAVTASGSHYWDRDAVRFARGKTDTRLYGGRYWVESRQFIPYDGEPSPREYQVAWVNGRDGEQLTIERFGHMPELLMARWVCRELAKLLEA